MNESAAENNILDRIDSLENYFVANEDKQLTQDIKDVIVLTPWDKIARDNRKLMRIRLGLTWHADITGDFDSIYLTLMKNLNKTKDVASKTPEDTRFRFIKKIINRITRINLVPQQAFNNELTALLDAFYREILELRAERTEMIQHIRDLSEQIAENEEKS
jgi:hypothetical protein